MSRHHPHRGLATLALALSSAVSLARPATPQDCAQTIGPSSKSILPSQSILYNQFWSVPAKSPTGWTFAWCNGNDIFARHFDPFLNGLGSQFLVNTTFLQDTQDEPAIAYGTNGGFMVAWSDRYGYDGSAMGCFARVYDAGGSPVGPEFVLNQITAASQWRPLLAPNPAGGWVAAWSGESDGNAYIRYLDENGAFLSADILVNTYLFDAQVDTAAAINEQGITFATFVDYSAHGGVGTGINLYGRTYDAAHDPRETQEFLLTTFTSDGDQRNPRIAVDGLGRFFVVWADQLGDGSGYGIFERIFDADGAPLGLEFPVNSTTAGNQLIPSIHVDPAGRAVVAWQDESQGPGAYQIRARLFDENASPLGPDFLVNDAPNFGAAFPFVAADATTSNIVVGWQAIGAGTEMDLYARRFQSTSGPQTYCAAKTNSQGCTPQIGWSGTPSATSVTPFMITGTGILNRKLGLLIYGYGSKFTPYQGSLLCVAPPFKRLAAQNSGGSPTGADCTGVLSTDFNERILSGFDPHLFQGATITARWYYRDPFDPLGFSSGLTDALRFTICP